MTLDLTEFYLYLLAIGFAVVVPIVLYAASYLADKVGFDLSDKANRIIVEYLERGHKIVAQKVEDNASHETSLSEKQAALAQWMLDHTPKAMKRAAYGPDDMQRLVNKYLKDKKEA